MKIRIGAHISTNKGLLGVVSKATQIGVNCLQIFSSAPLSFSPPMHSMKDCEEFKKETQKQDISPVFIHAKYLINLGSSKETLLNLSIKSLIDDLEFAHMIGAAGVIVHTGSHKGDGFETIVDQVSSSIQHILSKTSTDTKLFLEIASGGGGKIGSTFEELGNLVTRVKDVRLGICFDTAHMFAGGISFATPSEITELVKRIEKYIGWSRIGCIHVNDSKAPFGSYKDRHENLGEGAIGIESLKTLFKNENFNSIPLILETPGFDSKGPDKKNVDILKTLVNT